VDRQGGAKAAGDQHHGVQPPKEPVQAILTADKDIRLQYMGYGKTREKNTKDNKLAPDQNPHHGVAGQTGEGAPAASAMTGLRGICRVSVHDLNQYLKYILFRDVLQQMAGGKSYLGKGGMTFCCKVAVAEVSHVFVRLWTDEI
tara:strand:- start:1916 stop:2347 length:432 start_codon:yes stop_codon:yes gene_type:complete